ncbi:MAG: sigma-70 family RNA polymerase sigma factor [candidate division Zixibacteria bacterium]|jgi:RNA polymerase sigma-70 factor, ECF subfamily|nr:sigma-70 family RNA polymerase sigma factor [candidate division Zixibacteria bacterium]
MLERNKLTDVELMKRMQKQDMVAFNTFVDRYKNRLFTVINRMLDSAEEAEEIVQETFLRVYQHCHTFDFRFAVSTWVYTIALNLARNELRRKKRVKFFDIEDYKDKLSTPENQSTGDPAKLMAALKKAVQKLPPKYKEAFVLRDIDQLSYEEIAQILSVPLGTVKSRVNRARNLLRDQVKPKMEDYYELSKSSLFNLNII